MEDLTGIRERNKRKKGKRASKKQRRANHHASRWAFAELRGLLAYKATLAGSCCIRVDADYTSQRCPRCGFTSRANRPNHGLLFDCQQCHLRLHSDLVGARNICLRTLCIRQDWIHTGQLSSAPDVTDDEAKAARLSRYAELRWSSATSLPLKREVLDDSYSSEESYCHQAPLSRWFDLILHLERVSPSRLLPKGTERHA